MKYYVPASDLSYKKRRRRNKAVQLRNRLSRLRKRQRLMSDEVQESSTSGYETGATELDNSAADVPDQRLIVKLQLTNYQKKKSIWPKKAKKRALARANRQIRKLEDSVAKMKKQLNVKNTPLCRAKLIAESNRKHQNTPSKLAAADAAELKLTPKRAAVVRRKLQFGHALAAELQSSGICDTLKGRSSREAVVGKILKKYRLLSHACKVTGIGRVSVWRNLA